MSAGGASARDVRVPSHEEGEGRAPELRVEPPPASAPARAPRKRFFVPEVIQSSRMDCGPATLKALLGGFGIPVHYGRLREACRTSVDGTSIDTLEELANAFGLEARQTVVPADNVLVDEAQALPAIAVVSRPRMGNHFVVLWNRVGPFVQVMDPAAGRHWARWEDFVPSLLRYTATVPTEEWLAWARSPLFLRPLEARMRALGMSAREAEALLALALGREGWLAMGAMDAATRFCHSLRRAGIDLGSGVDTLRRLVEGVLESFDERFQLVPRHCWTVEGPGPDAASLSTTGVLLVTARKGEGAPESASALFRGAQMPGELKAALEVGDERPERELARLLAGERRVGLAMLALGALVAPVGLLCQSVLLRRLFDVAPELGLGLQRLMAALLLVGLLAGLAVLEALVFAGVQRLGRSLETRLRIAFTRKLPRLQDLYLQSRLSSDMAERSHMMHLVRLIPSLLFTGSRSLVGMLATVVAIGLMEPRLGMWVALLAVSCVLIPLGFRQRMTEQDLRARTQLGGLSRYYLDSLMGSVPLRAHGAQEALAREHEVLLVGWMRSSLQLLRSVVTMRATQALVGAGLSVALLTMHLGTKGLTGGTLLIAYWVMSLPDYAQQLAMVLQQYPASRNIALRCLEPLGAPEVEPRRPAAPARSEDASPSAGVGLALEGVCVEVAGHRVLHDVSLEVAPGAHIAIVGRSGAGKSTLLGLLLGWYTPSSGKLLIDGEALEEVGIEALRARTAWVDPAIQLWNQSMASNLTYGQRQVSGDALARVLGASELDSVLQQLEDGLQTSAGESGLRLSGGEGQRLRFARALLREGVGLALLDEPFRGLDREARRRFLAHAREHWKGATLLCVTHDVGETREFDEVLVIEEGRLIERGAPRELLERPGSRYAALLASEEAAQQHLTADPGWRRWRVEAGKLVE